MENETIQLAKIIAWPQMRAYKHLTTQITLTLSSPELRLISETLRSNPHEDPQSAMDWLCEEALRLSKSTQKHKNIRIETTPAKTGKKLLELRETCERLQKYSLQQKTEAEKAFREWLERGIITSAAFEEPNITDTDPIRKAIQTIEKLKTEPLAFQTTENTILFPLQNLEISQKPKLPTDIEPFDEHELEGGVEEDSTLILSGESNIGKSMLGLHILSTLCLRRHPVLLLSGEDSLETTRRRILAHFLHSTPKEITEMSETQRNLRFQSLYGNPENPQSLAHNIKNNFAACCIPEGAFHPKIIEERIDTFEQKTGKKAKAFMADYLQKMNENPAGRNPRKPRDEELEQTVNQIKDLCQNRKIFGIIISQVPSHAAGGSFEFLNLRQAVARSYAATWGAHYVITMNRTSEETKRLASSPDKRPRINLFLCKNKNGPLGCCHALGTPNKARWEFFRTKNDMLEKIEAESLSQKTPPKNLNPEDYKKNNKTNKT